MIERKELSRKAIIKRLRDSDKHKAAELLRGMDEVTWERVAKKLADALNREFDILDGLAKAENRRLRETEKLYGKRRALYALYSVAEMRKTLLNKRGYRNLASRDMFLSLFIETAERVVLSEGTYGQTDDNHRRAPDI